jgi:hypothetical protein
MDIISRLSGIVSIYGGGDILIPIGFLKNLQVVRNLSDLEPHCFFATSENGCTTKHL